MTTNNTNSTERKKKPSRRRTALNWGFIVLVILFFRYTDEGTVVQGWLQQGLLATGLFQPDLQYTENHDTPASYDLALMTLDGHPESLESFRGKTIFFNVWATWCPPCLAEMPYIQSLYDDVASEDIVFVTISTDDEIETAKQFIEAKGYSFPVYRIVGNVPAPYRSRSLPTTYVISPSGNLATVHYGMANYNTKGFKKFLRDLAEAGPQGKL